MSRVKSTTVMLHIALICLFAGVANAQYVMDAEEFEIPDSVIGELIGDNEIDSSEAMAEYVVSQTPAAIKKAAGSAGETLKIERTKMGFDGTNFFMQLRSKDGNMDIIFKDDIMYIINRDKKKVVKMTKEDREQIQKQAQMMTEKLNQTGMPNMDAIFSKLPKEQQDKIKEAMKGRGGMMGLPGGEEEEPVVEKTDKTANIANRATTLYTVKKSGETEGLWAAVNDKDLSAKYVALSEEFQNAMPMMKDKNRDHELVPYLPVATISVKQSMMGRTSARARYFTSIKNETPASEFLTPPGADQGYEETTLMEMFSGKR